MPMYVIAIGSVISFVISGSATGGFALVLAFTYNKEFSRSEKMILLVSFGNYLMLLGISIGMFIKVCLPIIK